MAKLSAEQIREIVTLFSQGTPVSSLSKKFGITNMVVYYHTKKYKVYKHRKPTCYKDYLINRICMLQEEYGKVPEEKKKYIRDEIKRIECSMHIKRDQCSSDPFVFQ